MMTHLTSDLKWTALGRLAITLATALTLVACSVRLETPVPTEPPARGDEIHRQRAVAYAEAIHQLAQDTSAQTTDPQIVESLNQVAQFSTEHIDALGGPYDSGLGPLSSPSPTPSDPLSVLALSTTPGRPQELTASPATVAWALTAASESAQASVPAVSSGTWAQLLAIISTSNLMSAQALNADSNASMPDPDNIIASLPSESGGLSATQLSAIITAEDHAGYVLEVQAARDNTDQTGPLVNYALRHRMLSQHWAELAQVSNTAQDPRLVAYTYPLELDAATLIQQHAQTIAQIYATCIATATPTTRTALYQQLVLTEREAQIWGAPPQAFPGMSNG